MFYKNKLWLVALSCVLQATAQTDTTRSLDEVVLKGIRAKNTAPITQYNLSGSQLKQLYYGADLPIVLQHTPSVNAYSDNGTGIGYSTFKLRGIDQTRINVTVNGVPINDPENQGTFFNNFADLSSSAHSVQIQRGVGTSTNGTAAFGGAVNILTRNNAETPSAEINLGIGSFGSRRITAEVKSGRIDNKYSFYTRLSNLATNGYRNNSGSEITSYFLSASRFGKKSELTLNAWGGDAQSTLAYLGIDKQTLNADRRANPFTRNESDRFRQHFFQAQYHYQLNSKSGINASAYYVRGMAPQFQVFFAASPFFPYSFFNMPEPIIGTDTIRESDAMVSYKLDQHFYGAFVNYFYNTKKVEINAGIHANSFKSDHFLEVQWMQVLPQGINPGHKAYFNTGYKQEASAFGQINYHLTQRWSVYADIQFRIARFQYEAQTLQYAAVPYTVENMQWVFINPKLGTTYQLNSVWSVYVMLGQNNREPTRFDYFQDDFATRNVKQSDIKPEKVTDAELGFRVNSQKLLLQVNGYYMQFNNAIINTGEINNFGYPITTNVSKSLRSGIEIDATWKLHPKLWFIHTSMFSQNNIFKLTQYYSDSNYTSVGIQYNNTTPALSPEIIINQGIKLIPVSWLNIDINGRYIAQQFVDNSQQASAKIPSFTVVDTRVGIALKKWLNIDANLAFQINNVLNNEYVAWGSVASFSNQATYQPNGVASGSVTPLFFAAPQRNYFVTLQLKF